MGEASFDGVEGNGFRVAITDAEYFFLIFFSRTRSTPNPLPIHRYIAKILTIIDATAKHRVLCIILARTIFSKTPTNSNFFSSYTNNRYLTIIDTTTKHRVLRVITLARTIFPKRPATPTSSVPHQCVFFSVKNKDGQELACGPFIHFF